MVSDHFEFKIGTQAFDMLDMSQTITQNIYYKMQSHRAFTGKSTELLETKNANSLSKMCQIASINAEEGTWLSSRIESFVDPNFELPCTHASSYTILQDFFFVRNSTFERLVHFRKINLILSRT